MLTGQHLPREGVPVVHSGQSRTDRQEPARVCGRLRSVLWASIPGTLGSQP